MTNLDPTTTTVDVARVENVNVNDGANGPANDTWTVRLVVALLGAIVLTIIVAETVLQAQDRSLPDVLLTLGGVAVGALGAMLASTASRKS